MGLVYTAYVSLLGPHHHSWHAEISAGTQQPGSLTHGHTASTPVLSVTRAVSQLCAVLHRRRNLIPGARHMPYCPPPSRNGGMCIRSVWRALVAVTHAARSNTASALNTLSVPLAVRAGNRRGDIMHHSTVAGSVGGASAGCMSTGHQKAIPDTNHTMSNEGPVLWQRRGQVELYAATTEPQKEKDSKTWHCTPCCLLNAHAYTRNACM
jgi:hypothetical protein